MMHKLDKQSILSSLGNRSPLTELFVFQSVNSTNQWLLESSGCNAVCIAEQQTSGRGRRGHVWQSDNQGNIYFSLSWCVSQDDLQNMVSKLSLLGLLVGLELCDLLAEFGLESHGLKWPNDILVNGQKLAGILIETTNNMQRLVIGLGININQHVFPGLEATSLLLELSRSIDRNHLVAMLISRLFRVLSEFPQMSFNDILYRWNHWDLLKGKEVNIHAELGVIRGLAMGINKQGELQLLQGNGENFSVNSADVSVRW